MYPLTNPTMMKRLKLAVRILLGLPLRGVRIDETLLLDKDKESESDYTKMPPFEISFDGPVPMGPPVEIIQEERFRVCVFREEWKGEGCGCGKAARWLVLELKGDDKWHHLVTMHESRLEVMEDVLGTVHSYLCKDRRVPPPYEVVASFVRGNALGVVLEPTERPETMANLVREETWVIRLVPLVADADDWPKDNFRKVAEDLMAFCKEHDIEPEGLGAVKASL